ncbi:lipopolysaccharide kinase InaA family protein [Pseudomonas sp.]|uniref:lipopolysaccharide kinase InaA family protein n=1 Tax=Pseudomonas sp. TaxID=306 RepID=UPI003D6EAD9A
MNEFSYTLNHRRSTLHFKTPPATFTTQALQRLVEQKRSAKRVSAPLDCPQSALFAKRQQLDSLKKKLRVAFGSVKRQDLNDWVIEELVNTAEAHKRGARVAPLIGFGYSRGRLGLMDDFFIITELFTGHTDGWQWVNANPKQVETLIASAFELLRSLHQQGISHMDLWAANVMVPDEFPGPAKAIDLENCFCRPTAFINETLGFQFGYFYFRGIYRFITEARYDELVDAALTHYPDVDRERFKHCYQLSKHEHVGRKDRRAVFLEGKLKSRW